MMKLYADENFPKPVVLILRKLGYDILTSESLSVLQIEILKTTLLGSINSSA
jgi:Domain of unknown function (DUF5615)